MDLERHVEALKRIEDPSVRAAFIYLLVASERAGLKTSPNSGAVYAVRLHNASGAYVFSYIANKSDLLFYLRHPAFEAYPGLRAAALASEFPFKENPAGELTVNLDCQTAASSLFDWLKTQVTF